MIKPSKEFVERSNYLDAENRRLEMQLVLLREKMSNERAKRSSASTEGIDKRRDELLKKLSEQQQAQQAQQAQQSQSQRKPSKPAGMPTAKSRPGRAQVKKENRGSEFHMPEENQRFSEIYNSPRDKQPPAPSSSSSSSATTTTTTTTTTITTNTNTNSNSNTNASSVVVKRGETTTNAREWSMPDDDEVDSLLGLGSARQKTNKWGFAEPGSDDDNDGAGFDKNKGSLLDGPAFDDSKAAQDFQAALMEWRNAGKTPAGPESSASTSNNKTSSSAGQKSSYGSRTLAQGHSGSASSIVSAREVETESHGVGTDSQLSSRRPVSRGGGSGGYASRLMLGGVDKEQSQSFLEKMILEKKEQLRKETEAKLRALREETDRRIRELESEPLPEGDGDGDAAADGGEQQGDEEGAADDDGYGEEEDDEGYSSPEASPRKAPNALQAFDEGYVDPSELIAVTQPLTRVEELDAEDIEQYLNRPATAISTSSSSSSDAENHLGSAAGNTAKKGTAASTGAAVAAQKMNFSETNNKHTAPIVPQIPTSQLVAAKQLADAEDAAAAEQAKDHAADSNNAFDIGAQVQEMLMRAMNTCEAVVYGDIDAPLSPRSRPQSARSSRPSTARSYAEVHGLAPIGSASKGFDMNDSQELMLDGEVVDIDDLPIPAELL